jgi:hypothetical protein
VQGVASLVNPSLGSSAQLPLEYLYMPQLFAALATSYAVALCMWVWHVGSMRKLTEVSGWEGGWVGGWG